MDKIKIASKLVKMAKEIMGKYYSDDDRWGNEDAEFKNFNEAVKAAMKLFDLNKKEAIEFCKETMDRKRSTY